MSAVVYNITMSLISIVGSLEDENCPITTMFLFSLGIIKRSFASAVVYNIAMSATPTRRSL